MRTTLKIVLPLIISVVVVSLLFAVYQVRTEKRLERNELSRRAETLAESLEGNIEPLFDRPLPDKSLQRKWSGACADTKPAGVVPDPPGDGNARGIARRRGRRVPACRRSADAAVRHAAAPQRASRRDPGARA